MTTAKLTISLVLHEDDTEKRVEITETPKKVKHLKVLTQKNFNLFSTTSQYFIHFNDQKEQLLDDEMDLTTFYSMSDIIEIHVHKPTESLTASNAWNMISFTPGFTPVSNTLMSKADELRNDHKIDTEDKL